MKQNTFIVACLTPFLVLNTTLIQEANAQTHQAEPIMRQVVAGQVDHSPLQLVKTFLTAVQQGDHRVPKRLLHPNVKWHQPGKNRFAGLKQSSTAVFEMVRAMSEASSKTFRLAAVKSLTVHENQVACLLTWQAVMEGGGVLDVDNIDVYTISDGKIVEAKIYSVNQAHEDEFWGR